MHEHFCLCSSINTVIYSLISTIKSQMICMSPQGGADRGSYSFNKFLEQFLFFSSVNKMILFPLLV